VGPALGLRPWPDATKARRENRAFVGSRSERGPPGPTRDRRGAAEVIEPSSIGVGPHAPRSERGSEPSVGARPTGPPERRAVQSSVAQPVVCGSTRLAPLRTRCRAGRGRRGPSRRIGPEVSGCRPKWLQSSPSTGLYRGALPIVRRCVDGLLFVFRAGDGDLARLRLSATGSSSAGHRRCSRPGGCRRRGRRRG
jgi:hypothetical protein